MKKLTNNFKKKSLVIVNLFLIFTLMTVSVYSWFASHVDNEVDAYDIQVHSDNDLELSFTGEENTWKNLLNIDEFQVDGVPVKQVLNMVEITGDGENFSIPQLTQKVNYAEVYPGGTWDDAKANEDYLQLVIHMRSLEPLDVYLSSDSKAAPKSADFIGTDCGNPTEMGNKDFSKDCVVGALRVGLPATGAVWITNPEFHLDNVIGSDSYAMNYSKELSATYLESYENDGIGPKDNNSDGKITEADNCLFVWNNPTKHYYYKKEATSVATHTKAYYQLPNTVSTIDTNAVDTKLVTLKRTETSGDYYVGEATINVWIEGCDTEARKALIGGEFNLALVFDSYPAGFKVSN